MAVSRRRLPLPTLLVAAVVVALAACGETPSRAGSGAAGPPDLEESLTGHVWLLDVSDSSLTGAGGTPITLAFADATAASGSAPCNTYRGAVVLDGDDGVRIQDVATTLMGCETDVMAAEQEYLEALARARTADVTVPGRLVLTAEGVRLSFTGIDAAQQLTGDWALTGVRKGDGIQTMVAGTEPVARFGTDGSLAVETGCNVLRTTWQVEDRAITVEEPARSSMDCPEPAGVMEQEEAIASALTAAATVQVTPAALMLLDAVGDIVLTADRR